ncbi:protein suppressor 2 of zeste [Anopheles bellator]|uniref:protein suppressor 2 of zeste n=1 Tax=Anopheles bellator TaxID=139047 RepID=UPI0026489C2E|nr:protein suppressor 2 of zeste [Anopheles bellator]
MMMPDAERSRMRSSAGGNRRRVKDFNDSITCTLCSGYLIEATTINDCLHAFCRSCIVQYLDTNKYCPRCKSYNSKPITVASLRPDRTLRALVYKMVPGLHKSEIQRTIQFYSERHSNNAQAVDDQLQGCSLLEDQNFYSPEEPISLSLEYLYDTLPETQQSVATKESKLPVTYLQCPAAVTVHHLYKFILTKNGLLVGSDNIRVEIIYEDEILPHNFTLMDVAYCFDYKRVAPMRFFYRILIHSSAKPPQTAAAHRSVEGQDKGSTGTRGGSAANTAQSAAAPGSHTTATRTDGGQRGGTGTKEGGGHSPGKAGTNGAAITAGGGNKENTITNGTHAMPPPPPASNVSGAGAVGIEKPAATAPSTATPHAAGTRKDRVTDAEKKTATKSSAAAAGTVGAGVGGGLKMVLVAKGKNPPEVKKIPPPLKVLQQQPPAVVAEAKDTPAAVGLKGEAVASKAAPKAEVVTAASPVGKRSPPSGNELKCYVNLKKQTIVAGAVQEIPRLKIELPRLKTKLSGGSPSNSSSSSSSAATSPSSSAASSSTGKSPVWPMGKEEYAKTIGLKPVYAGACEEQAAQASRRHKDDRQEWTIDGEPHRKRKKGKHSKEASGKRRKLHAEISSQQDASLKMKVKLTEKPPKHERLRSTGHEDEPASPPSSPVAAPTDRAASPPKPVPAAPSAAPPVATAAPPKVIDITKDDDDVKFVNEQPPVAAVPPAPAPPPAATKEKLADMRAIRHKPMVYIPNLDRSLSADSASGSFNSLLESVQAKAGPPRSAPATTTTALKPTPALIVAAGTAAGGGLVAKSQPRTPILSPRTMQSYPPLAYPLTTSSSAAPAAMSPTGPVTGGIRTMAPSMKRPSVVGSDSSAGTQPPKVARLEPPSLVSPMLLASPKKQGGPIHAPMFNFAKGANRAKAQQAQQQAAGLVAAATAAGQQPPTSDLVPYRSSISSSYTTKEPIGPIKKPIPNLLLPPSSISVTKMSDMVTSSSSASVDGRPALEIVRIPSTAPVADKPSLAPFTSTTTTTSPVVAGPKTTRPPPATIPLIKIKKPAVAAAGEGTIGAPPGMTPITPGMLQKIAARSQSESGGLPSILDLSGNARRRPAPTAAEEAIILEHLRQLSAPKKGIDFAPRGGGRIEGRRNSIPGLKLPPEMIGFPVPSPSPPSQKTLAPLPKLTEINRNRNLAVRQPNASIRNIPNPSALAFRGAQSSSGQLTLTAPPSSGMLISASSSAGSPPSVNGGRTANGGGSTISNGAPKSADSTPNGHSRPANGKPSIMNGAGATIEKVAAVLKAAKATGDTTTTVRPGPASQAASRGSSTNSTTTATSTSVATVSSSTPTTNGVGSSTVTSVTTGGSISSVTNTNGKAASIINVG